MLVPGLESSLLSTITSGDRVDYSRVHNLLCQCAREMLAKYAQKQERNGKLAVKNLAVKALLIGLNKVTGSQPATCVIISSALKHHAEVLHGYEHLLSIKGNTYALMKQTKGLMEDSDYAPGSLLRYHEIKNKLLEPGTPLSNEQKEVISELIKKNLLTMKTLEALEAHPGTVAKYLMRLGETILLKPELCAMVAKQKKPVIAAKVLLGLNGEILHYPVLCAGILEHKDPAMAVRAVERLNEADMLEVDLCKKVLEHENSDSIARALVRLKNTGMHNPDLWAKVVAHEKMNMAADAIVELIKHKLDSEDNCLAVLSHKNSFNAALAIIRLDFYSLLSDERRDQVLRYKNPATFVRELVHRR